MSSKKISLPKIFICASIKGFCSSLASADPKNFRCEIALETANNTNMIIDTLSVTGKDANVIIPIIGSKDLMKLRLLDAKGPISTVNYSIKDFEGFKGSCFSQWTNFQLKPPESKSIKQSPAAESDSGAIKVLFEFIVDNAGNIKKFQEHRDKLVEIFEKTSAIEDASLNILSNDNAALDQEPIDLKNNERNISNSKGQEAKKHSKEEQTGGAKNQLTGPIKFSTPKKQSKETESPQNSAVQLEYDNTVNAKENNSVSSFCCQNKFNTELSQPASVDCPANRNGCHSGNHKKAENVRQKPQNKSFLDLASQNTLPIDQRYLEFLNLNNQFISNLQNSGIATFFGEFLSQINSFVEEFKKTKAENEHFKHQIKQLEGASAEEREHSQHSRASLLSTEPKSGQPTPKSADATSDPQDLNLKIALFENKLQDKEKELRLLHEENKLLNKKASLHSIQSLQKKHSKVSESIGAFMILKAENEKLKADLIKENSNSMQLKRDLERQYKKNDMKDEEMKRMYIRIKELEKSVCHTTKALVSLEFQRGGPGAKEDAESFDSDSLSNNGKSISCQNHEQESKEVLKRIVDNNSNQSEAEDFDDEASNHPLKVISNINRSPNPAKQHQEVIKIQYSGDGMYNFGNKKIYVKKSNGTLFVKMGGGFVTFQKFLVMQKELGINAAESPFRAQTRSITPKERVNSFITANATQAKITMDKTTPKKLKQKTNIESHQSAFSPISFQTPNRKEDQAHFSMTTKMSESQSFGKKCFLSSNVPEQAFQSLAGKRIVHSASKIAKACFK